MINEGIEYNDMRGLISNTLIIDKYKPKIGNDEDTVVVTLNVEYENPAKDLSNFIESSDIDHLDVDISSSPNQDGSYYIFVEFMRDYNLFKKINSMLETITRIVDKDRTDWKYIAFRVKEPVDFNEENFKRDIISSAVKYRMDILSESSQISRIKQLVNY